MCALAIALIILGVVVLALFGLYLYLLLRLGKKVDDAARRIICIVISEGEEHEKGT